MLRPYSFEFVEIETIWASASENSARTANDVSGAIERMSVVTILATDGLDGCVSPAIGCAIDHFLMESVGDKFAIWLCAPAHFFRALCTLIHAVGVTRRSHHVFAGFSSVAHPLTFGQQFR